MSSFTSQLLSYVLIYKYLAIFVITFLGAFALPLPSGTVLIAGTAFATQGYLNTSAVWICGLLGNLAGDSSMYWLVRKYGLEALKKIRRGKIIESDKHNKVREMLNRHPVLTIYFSRFFTGIAPTVNVLAGLFGMPYKRFLTFEFLGEVTEVSFFCGIGYFLGSNWQTASPLLSKSWWVLLLGAAATYLFWKIILRRRHE